MMKIKNHLLNDPKATIGHSPNQGGTISPTVIVLHYTASGGEDGQGDADYLSRASSRASAHVVVGRNGSIDQIVPFNKKAWHAGVSKHNGRDNVNDFSIGIEIDNWGWLKNGKSHSGAPIPAHLQFAGSRGGHNKWEAYREEQLQAVEEVVKAICDTYPIEDIVGHEEIAPGRKQDPGPALDEFMAHLKKTYLKKPKSKSTTKTTTDLRLRTRPSITGAILTVMPEGAAVQVLSRDANWAKVKYGNRIGYCSAKYLT